MTIADAFNCLCFECCCALSLMATLIGSVVWLLSYTVGGIQRD
jgi:hypothetical protein